MLDTEQDDGLANSSRVFSESRFGFCVFEEMIRSVFLTQYYIRIPHVDLVFLWFPSIASLLVSMGNIRQCKCLIRGCPSSLDYSHPKGCVIVRIFMRK